MSHRKYDRDPRDYTSAELARRQAKRDSSQARWKAKGGKTLDENGRELSDAEWAARFKEAQDGGRPFRWKVVQPPRSASTAYCRICKGPHKPKHGRP